VGSAPARGYYDRERHWRDTAGLVARRGLVADGVWSEVFDAAALRAAGEPAPIEAVMTALAEVVVRRGCVTSDTGPREGAAS
jgi:hypothetical protein